jgi:type IV pilus assembly protein PilN
MIRINLLTGERKSLKKKVPFQIGQKLTVGCALVLLAAGSYIGWRVWAIRAESARLDTEISTAQKETARLHTIIVQVQQFEQRKAQLQQRVTLIEQLRKDQTGPVHMLDQISRALPAMLWLTDIKQTPNSDEVLIGGRSTSMTGLSDFVTNLEASGYFKRSIEIVSSTTENVAAAPGEIIKFEIKAVFQTPGTTPPAGQGTAGPASGESQPRS